MSGGTEETSTSDMRSRPLSKHYSGKESDRSNPQLSDTEAENRFIEWYEEICKERIAMSQTEEEYKAHIYGYQEAEKSYQRRINELEKSSSELAKAFEEAQNEAKFLRKKFEPPADENTDNGAYFEPYNIVVKEKMKLLETQKINERKIKALEEEVVLLRNKTKNLETTDDTKPEKRINRRKRTIVVIANLERLEALEKENKQLKDRAERTENYRRALEAQIGHLETKLRSIELSPIRKKLEPIKRAQSKIVINKRCVPTFLTMTRVPLKTSISVDDMDGRISNRSSQSQEQCYGQLYIQRKSASSDDTSSMSSTYKSIYKYML